MKFLWQIEDSDILKVKSFYNAQKTNPFVLNRIQRNVGKIFPEFSKEYFWEAMIACLITTQQRSGPDSAVTKFICIKPSPLNYSVCKETRNLSNMVEDVISRFGGLRRGKTIGEEVEYNFIWLEKDGWQIICEIIEDLKDTQESGRERKAAEVIIDNLKGFGPKQFRNLLQSLGLKCNRNIFLILIGPLK